MLDFLITILIILDMLRNDWLTTILDYGYIF